MTTTITTTRRTVDTDERTHQVALALTASIRESLERRRDCELAIDRIVSSGDLTGLYHWQHAYDVLSDRLIAAHQALARIIDKETPA